MTETAITREAAIALAVETLWPQTFEARGLHMYRDDATGTHWISGDDDMELLGRMLAGDVSDAYSRWCSATSAREVDCEAIVIEWGLDENTDLTALQAEAGAADDMVAYMALRFLRDDIVEIIEQDAEIAGESA